MRTNSSDTLSRIIASLRNLSTVERVGYEVYGGAIRFYPVEPCEGCEADCEGPNATGWLTFEGHTAQEIAAAVEKVPGVEPGGDLPELGWVDAIGGAGCPDCDTDD